MYLQKKIEGKNEQKTYSILVSILEECFIEF